MTAPNIDDFLLVGRISAAFGVRGELKISMISSHPEHIQKLKHLFVGNLEKPYTIGRLHQHKGSLYLLRLSEVDTREAAEAMQGLEAYIHRSDAAPLANDEYFLHDLVGLQVQTEAGDVIGQAAEIIETGANDVLVVRKLGQADILVPMVRAVVRSIDIAGGTITVTSLADIVPE
ncbi:ribosome maturation factor RimM [Herpetosiphon llansteffanensis]